MLLAEDKKRPRTNETTNTTSKRIKNNVVNNASKSPWSRPLAAETDKDNLNDYSCLFRQHLELFCVTQDEIDGIIDSKKSQGRRGIIVAGQVGLRCTHCHQILSFPTTLVSVHQNALNSVPGHFKNACSEMSDKDWNKLFKLKEGKGRYKQKTGLYTTPEYVARCLRDIGIQESPDGPGLFLSSG